jgi:hypothetical protein
MVLLEAIYVDHAGSLEWKGVIHIVIDVLLVRLVTSPSFISLDGS